MTLHSTTGVTTAFLDVPGGRLYYEVRGSGSVLLVVGQPMTSGAFAATADVLADSHTVVTYDPRGLGRSAVDDPTQDVTPDIEGDDLAALIETVGGGQADVFGTSGGAVAGLALVTRHPERVRTLIAHEPPVTELVPDAVAVRAAVDDIRDAYRNDGSAAAWPKFISLVVHNGVVPDTGVPPMAWPPPGPQDSDHVSTNDVQTGESAEVMDERDGPVVQEPGEQSQGDSGGSEQNPANDDLFFLHMLRPFTRYQPVIELLRSSSPRVVVGIGASSGEELARRSAIALAERIGSPAVTFPGDHGGFMADPAGFAAAIERSLVASEAG